RGGDHELRAPRRGAGNLAGIAFPLADPHLLVRMSLDRHDEHLCDATADHLDRIPDRDARVLADRTVGDLSHRTRLAGPARGRGDTIGGAMNRSACTLAALAVLATLGGCGQKGALYLPDKKKSTVPAAAPAPAAPAPAPPA